MLLIMGILFGQKLNDYKLQFVWKCKNEKDKIILSQFEKLSYNEKLDVISELVIRYNNNSMFKNQEIHIPFNDDVDGFELARLIQK